MHTDQQKFQFVYRIATLKEWALTQESGYVPTRPIDKKDGYMHLSTREHLMETAQRHFVGVKDLLALEIPLEGIGEKVKFELATTRGAMFPHLYGRLVASDVIRAIKLMREGDHFKLGEAF